MTAKTHAARSPILEVFPYLCVRNAAAAIDFYVAVFGAAEITRLQEPGGRIVHAELRLGPITLMLADELPEYSIVSPQTPRATAAATMVLRGPTDEAHGERQCRLRDPFGHEWLLGHELEKVSDL